MSVRRRTYRYVGPADPKSTVHPGGAGRTIGSEAHFDNWVSEQLAEELAEPFTFVVDAEVQLRLAPAAASTWRAPVAGRS